MKIKTMAISIFLALTIIMSGCSNNIPQETQIDSESIEQSQESLEKIDSNTSTEKRYYVTIQVKQSHFSLNIKEHLKDNLNKCWFEIPVDKEFYDSVSVGQVLEDSFRAGSAILNGSFGNLKVTIIDKEIK